MGFVMFIDELAYTNGSFWGAIDETHIFTASTAILMTAIVIAAMAIKSRRRIMNYFSIESILLISAYTVTSVLIFLYSNFLQSFLRLISKNRLTTIRLTSLL